MVYEIAWLRLLALTLGNTAYATSCILAVFLGGLALGAYFGGKLADRFGFDELHHYGIVELAIGLSAPATTYLLSTSPEFVTVIARSIPDSLFAQNAATMVIGCLILLPATMLMGATLPLVMKFAAHVGSHREWFSWLYGMNTLGAVIGSFSAAFLGFAYIGIFATTVVAGALNALVGIANIVAAARLRPDRTAQEHGEPAVTANTIDRTFILLCTLSFLAGYTAVSYEVLWTRLLRFFTGSLTYAFSIMLGTFLLGLAAGSFVYQKRILKRDSTNEQRFFRFAKLQYLAAIACAGSLIAVPIALVIHLPIDAHSLTNPWPAMANTALISFVVIFLPALLIGTLFPLLGTIASDRHKLVASSIGLVYAANTLGCVLGSIITGLLLMPSIGSYRAFQLTVLLSAITGFIAVHAAGADKKKVLAAGGLPVAAAAAFMIFVYVPYSTFISVTDGSILKAGEDAIGSMVVLDFPKSDTRVLLFNGSSLATTAMPSRRYMRMLGHLPVLLHENPQDVMVACFGTGTTCGAAAIHQNIKNVNLVELSSMVLSSGNLFSSSNQRVLESPKLHPVITDARNFLLRTDKRFDVITFEPPPPCDAGIVNLYTKNFYQLVKSKLRPDGLMAQWVPLHDASTQLWKMQCRAAKDVFAYVSVWLPNSGEALLLCGEREPQFDIASINSRIQTDPALRKSLQEVGFDSAADILASFVADGRVLNDYIAGVPEMTDDKPSLEFFHPYAGPLIEDDKLFQLGGFATKPFSNDSEVQLSHTALGRTFQPAPNKDERYKLLESAVDMRPENHWFKWLLENTKPPARETAGL